MATAQRKQLTEVQIADKLQELADIQNRITADEQRYNELYDDLKALEPGTYHGYGAASVRISRNSRLDTVAALEMMAPRSKAKVMVLRPDASLIRKNFPGIARRATVQYDNKVSLNLALNHLQAVED